MIETITTNMPPMPMRFNPHLLSMPTFGFSTKNLLKIAKFLQKKIDSGEFKKFPKTKERLENKQKHFMELYGRAIIEEEKAKEKKGLKTHWFGYRPRLANRNDQRLFERLDNRRETSRIDRRNNKVQKICKVKR